MKYVTKIFIVTIDAVKTNILHYLTNVHMVDVLNHCYMTNKASQLRSFSEFGFHHGCHLEDRIDPDTQNEFSQRH